MTDTVKKAFCINCAAETEYYIETSPCKITIHGLSYSYLRKTAYCSVCGNTVYVPDVNDENVRSVDEKIAQHIKESDNKCE